MRIGILTLPLEVNYGANLQAFALQKTLLKMGFEVITIDRHNRRRYPSTGIHIAGFIKRQFEYYFMGKDVCTKWNPFISDEEYAILSSNTQKFIDRNIRLTRRVYSDELEEIDKEYNFDTYIVGSDQVWLDEYCPNSFLDFVHRPNIKKIVYAASCNEKNAFFGNLKKLKQCQRLVKYFSGISVREEYLVQICQEKMGINSDFVLDPTLLLTPQEYLDVIDPLEKEDPIIFSYILDDSPQKRMLISSISKDLRLPVVEGNILGKVDGHVRKINPYPSIDDWLNNLYRSKFVITDSFHGTVFSILFNKPFVVIGNEQRGINRFNSLLALFKLQSHLISERNLSILPLREYQNIDFDTVNLVLSEYRKRSMNFLMTNCINC